MAPAPFAQWKRDSLQVTGSFVPASGGAPTWWGLNAGATAGAASVLMLTQGLCERNDGCVAESIGYSLLGGLLGGAIDAGIKY